MSKNRSWSRVLVALAAFGACVGMSASGTWAGPKPVKPCITPTDVNLNERYGVSDAIVAPFCPAVSSGRRWTVSSAWSMNSTFEDPGPAEFEPAGATPLEDFIAKLIGVKYVVDPGTNKEKTYLFPNADNLGVFVGDDFAIANPLTLGSVQPLNVGDHVVDSYLLFRAMHCDGLGHVIGENCLPAGETFYDRVQFTVTPGHN